MYILGLSAFAHESSCSLIKDGEIRVVLEEERFNREKHTSKFPINAIEQCLSIEGITISEIDKITFFWHPMKEVTGNIIHVIRYLPESLNLLRTHSGSDEWSFLKRFWSKQNIGRKIKNHFGLNKTPVINYIEHPLSHAGSAFFVSPFHDAAILTIDGRGESTTTMLAVGRANKIEKIKEIKVPHSLGHLYAAVTDHLGFRPFFDEWKVMGMAAYGKNTYINDFKDIVSFKEDGGFQLNLKYFKFHTHSRDVWLSDSFAERYGPKRRHDDPYNQRHYDLAFALQSLVEKAGVILANHLHHATGLKNLCMNGGVVLNCLMNKKIIEKTPFENFFFQPIASDAGTSLGSALYYYHHVLNNNSRDQFKSASLGCEFNNDQIEQIMNEKKLKYVKSNNIAKDAAQYIADGKIVGWFQGKMEAGPRALGHRSITVNPMDPDMKKRLNDRVKKREFFRPFAPSVLEERVDEYFVMPKGQLSPFMILVGEVREDKKNVIPAVTHADGTARVHTVNRDINPLYWELIREFEKITGVPVILNTSFNENEPIVRTPDEALNCFLRTDFDVLSIGDYIVLKKDNRV